MSLRAGGSCGDQRPSGYDIVERSGSGVRALEIGWFELGLDPDTKESRTWSYLGWYSANSWRGRKE